MAKYYKYVGILPTDPTDDKSTNLGDKSNMQYFKKNIKFDPKDFSQESK